MQTRVGRLHGPHDIRIEQEAVAAPALGGPAMSLAEAAVVEPLAVCLHAVARACELSARRLLVTGGAPSDR